MAPVSALSRMWMDWSKSPAHKNTHLNLLLKTNPTPLMINLFMTNPAAPRRLQYPLKSGLNKKERVFLIHQEISNLYFIAQMYIYIYTVCRKWAMHWHCLFEGCNHSARIVAKLSGVRTKENLSFCKETCKSSSLLH